MTDQEELQSEQKKEKEIALIIKDKVDLYKKQLSSQMNNIEDANNIVNILDVSRSRGHSLSIGYESKDEKLATFKYKLNLTVNKKRTSVKIDLSDFLNMNNKTNNEQTKKYIKLKIKINEELLELSDNIDFESLIEIEKKRDYLKKTQFNISSIILKMKQDESLKKVTETLNNIKEPLSKEEVENLIFSDSTFLILSNQYSGDILLGEFKITSSGCQRITYYVEGGGGKKIKYNYEDLIKYLYSALKVNGRILNKISELQDVYEPNRPEHHKWAGSSDYALFSIENFNEIFGLKNKVDAF
jgi:hypothetical protein